MKFGDRKQKIEKVTGIKAPREFPENHVRMVHD